ncbi:MAG: Aerobic glycerol-3-phosphate dehydrogenase [Chlamydiales bacterium]|nr:Aerobic glycerol-3-phosphate dehydrogenase [Chlamydiales bacterium]MCH9619588.1 Aerobic glycerol-3-phosphate dehydrogenase [Chlamydiales bacterium]MCH9623194.1 Aerobic glycerol-3-phosphate dehydrogenase [Chlamydiales bacterium]
MIHRKLKHFCFLLLFLVSCQESSQEDRSISKLPLPSREEMVSDGDTFDLLVIGGGATGAGVALDAASRGLSVLLVEKSDFGSQTSSRSTKLVHGGVRYLEKAIRNFDRKQYHLVKDALHERGTLLHIAPHMVHPIKIVTPAYSRRELPYFWTGLKLYDLVAGRASISKSRFLTSSEIKRTCPTINPDGLRGGVSYYDAQFNDTRLNITLILSAMHLGAKALNYTEMTQLIKEDGKIVGASLYDRMTGQHLRVNSRVVVNATGPFSDRIRQMDDPDEPSLMRPSAGTHLLLDKAYLSERAGILIPKTKDGRIMFLLPWEGGTIVGTTDYETELTETPHSSQEEFAYILSTISNYLDEPVTPCDVKAVWTGFRPLVCDPKVKKTEKLCRDHIIRVSSSGLVSIMGGKWTTYRKMAEETVDTAFPDAQQCGTEHLLLLGAENFTEATVANLVEKTGLDFDICQHLVHAYGTVAFDVVKAGPLRRLSPQHPIIEAEVFWAIEHEYAETIVDVLARRTRLAFLDANAAIEAVERVALLMNKREQIEEAKQELHFLFTNHEQNRSTSAKFPKRAPRHAPL